MVKTFEDLAAAGARHLRLFFTTNGWHVMLVND